MSKERLTVADEDLGNGMKRCHIIDGNEVRKHAMDFYWRLKEYEDLEEQGLLLRLPCKAGDTVYKIDKEARKPVIAMIVTEIRFKALRSGKVITKILCSDDVMTKTNGCLVYYEEEIGKKLFLTQSEAEEKLRELLNEESEE